MPQPVRLGNINFAVVNTEIVTLEGLRGLGVYVWFCFVITGEQHNNGSVYFLAILQGCTCLSARVGGVTYGDWIFLSEVSLSEDISYFVRLFLPFLSIFDVNSCSLYFWFSLHKIVVCYPEK